jgi:hypothetical protein
MTSESAQNRERENERSLLRLHYFGQGRQMAVQFRGAFSLLMFKAAKIRDEIAFKPQGSAILNILQRPPVRECLVFIAFCFFTVLMTWPWVLHLRDAVADRGDPYMIAWTLWWDYHQTFRNPLHLFDANIFFSRPFHGLPVCLHPNPTDESVGYYHSSALFGTIEC